MEVYLPVAELSVNWAMILGMGAAVGFLSGMFGVGGGFLMTPLLVFYGIPPGIAVATQASHITASSLSGALAQWRRQRVCARRLYFSPAPAVGADRARGHRELCRASREYWRIDAERKRPDHPQGARRNRPLGGETRPAQLDPWPTPKDALPAIEALHQCHSATCLGRPRRRAHGDHGGGGWLHHGSGDDLSPTDANECRRR